MIKAIIIEDEKNSREVLRSAIDNFIEGIEVVAEAHDVSSGIDLINKVHPELIFLDIELPDGKGFDILDKVESSSFKVIFVTAYNDYAIKAIRYAAFDYLVKPLDIDDLERAVSRLGDTPKVGRDNVAFLKEQLEGQNEDVDKLLIPSYNGYQMISFEDIISVEVHENNVFFELENGMKHVAAHSLTYYENLLPTSKFFRIHKSHIINYTKVSSVESGRTGSVVLKNGKKLDIAARRKSTFLSYMKKYL